MRKTIVTPKITLCIGQVRVATLMDLYHQQTITVAAAMRAMIQIRIKVKMKVIRIWRRRTLPGGTTKS